MEIVVMVVVGLVGLAILLAVKWLGNRIAGRTRGIGSRRSQARRHFVKAAQLLESSRSPGKRKLAWNAISEADMAIELDPTDAALYIVKSIALEQLGRPADALRALSVALTTPAVRTLSTSERAEALAKRAGLYLEQAQGKRGLDRAIADLEESLKLKGQPNVWCILAACYERARRKDKAVEAYRNALALDGNFSDAKEGLSRVTIVAFTPSTHRSVLV